MPAANRPTHDPAALTAALAGLELALRRAIELAPATNAALKKMAGTVIAIELVKPAVEVFLLVQDEGYVGLMAYSELRPAARVRGPLDSFVALATADDPAATLINSDIEVIGNTGPLLELQAIISDVDIDWEAPLVDSLGDVLGHQVAETLRGIFGWSEQAAARLRRQLSEYILEEGRLSPPAVELEDFYQRAQALSLRVDRLASRTQRLSQRIDRLLP